MKSTAEGLSDAMLFILVTLPAALLWVTSLFCSGWNEGTGGGTCVISALEGVYEGISGIMLIFAFGGFLFWLPAVLLCMIVSATIKIRALRRSDVPMRVVNILFLAVPLFILAYGVWQFVLI